MKITSENYISELKKHNESALAYIIEVYGGLVKSIVRKHLYALPQYPEECMSDIFLQIWNNIQYYDCIKNSFQNWLALMQVRAVNSNNEGNSSDKYAHLLRIPYENIVTAGIRPFAEGEF